ncbi:TonB-dependent receptor [Sphingomonas hengshuiensis]|uniref:TonB-dependent receptor n=1 Tax=Sphingomonas hengshuiensis TaxID=1609977 RepID=UPI000696E343|nr:TonB-dependent receptor [Sphingomonas hengshuiensis]
MNIRFRAHLSSTAALAALTILLAPAAFAQTAEPDPAATPGEASAQDDSADAIVVTGIRRSLQDAINAKRAAGNIVDVISAQDIGKLPDQNVAESMSRITGVQITRSEGDGSNFTVRGISQNRLEINGRSFLGPSSGGGASLESLSPEIISTIVVSKTPTADMPEGALGATVNLKTKRPLELGDFVASGRLQGVYTDQADKMGYRGSALISKTFSDSFGILGTVAYSDIKTQAYAFDTGGWTRTNGIDGNGDGTADTGLYRPNRLMQKVDKREQRRLTAQGSAQFRPDDRWEIILDGTYSRLDIERVGINNQILLNDNDVGAVIDSSGSMVKGTLNNVTVRPLIYDAPTLLESTNLGFSTSYKSEIVEVAVDASYSKASSEPANGSSMTYVVVQKNGNVADASFDFLTGNAVPDISLATNFNTLDPSQYRLTSIFDGAIMTDNDGYDARMDFKIHTNFGPLSSVEVGSRFEHLSLYSEAPQNIPGVAGLLALGDKNGDGIITINELPGVNYSGTISYFPGQDGNFQRELLDGSLNSGVARDAFNLPTPAADTIPLGRVSIKDVTQDTLAFYIKGNIDTTIGSMPLTGNAGVRYVSQERLSAGYLSDTQPTATKPTFDYWLPSANLSLAIRDDLTFRAAAAKVVARPSLADVAVSFVPLLVSRTGNRGNPNLRPYEATQFDATLEWYFAPASALTGAVFYKNVDSFTINLTQEEFIPGVSETYGTFQITQPVNGRAGKIKGFEVAFQQSLRFLPAPFDNLGVQANYTYVDSETPLIDEETQKRLPLPGLSKHSYNLIGYYEDKLMSLRLAYIHRNSYLQGQGSAAAGGSSYMAGRGQLDFSAQVNLSKNLRMTLEAINLTKEGELQYLQNRNRLLYSAREDRRIFAGVAVTF